MVDLHTGIHGISLKSSRDYFEYLLELLKLEDKRDTEVRFLSSGYKQKVAVACTLAKRTPLVFLDEPTLGLDVESSYQLRAALRKLQAEENHTIIISSHDMKVIQDVCSRVIIISQGKLIANKSIKDLIALFRTRKFKLVLGNGDEGAIRQALNRVEDAFPGTVVTTTPDSVHITVTLGEVKKIYELVDIIRLSGAAIET